MQGISINKRDVAFTASIGIAMYPDDGLTSEELLKNADAATHHAKRSSQDRFTFYTKKLLDKVERKLALEEKLRFALRRNEFHVVYQPKIDVKTGALVSLEALVRWENDSLGSVSPVEFIPIAESNGMIDSIGIFVLRTALRDLAKLNEILSEPIDMAVNISPRQFRSEHLSHLIADALKTAGVESKYLELEITEGVLVSGLPNIDGLLEDIHKLGVKLAMDDFGTGYSSLSYLRRYTFNTLKIDREFISDLDTKRASQELVAATIAMAHNLHMVVVAEGVETKAQFEMLKQYGCDLVQGWYFSKPLSLDDLFQWVKSAEVTRLSN